MGVFAHYGLIKKISSCPIPRCKGKPHIVSKYRSDNGRLRYEWYCSSDGADHMQESVTGIGPLTKIRVGGWMPFLNFVFLLNKNRALHLAHTEVQDAWGNISDTALREWRRLYQDGLKTANEKLGLLKIGGARPQQIVVVDESIIGVHHSDGAESMVHGGISKGAPRVRSSSRSRKAVRDRIAKVLPAKTLWKRPAAHLQKKPAAIATRPSRKGSSGLRKRPAAANGAKKKIPKKADTRSDGRWLWAAVSVGHGTTTYSHANKMKRFAWKILPSKGEAVDGKPRGTAEIRDAMVEHIKKGSKLVFDGWLASTSAAAEANYQHAPPVVHDVNWRDAETGWHSNDIESEFNRFKHWSRVRYGVLSVTELDLHEYSFYINGGDKVDDALKGIGVSAGGRPFVL